MDRTLACEAGNQGSTPCGRTNIKPLFLKRFYVCAVYYKYLLILKKCSVRIYCATTSRKQMAETLLQKALRKERRKNPLTVIVRDKDGGVWFASVHFICGVPFGTRFSRRTLRIATRQLGEIADAP